MGNLFSDLIKYGQTEERSQLENFTTEILKYLLRQKDQEILKFVLEECKMIDYFDKNPRIDSQVDIGKGFVDILITDDKSFGIIIENKIDASFQEQQIERYKEYGKRLWGNNSFVLVLAKNIHEFDEHIGIPDGVLYWSRIAEFLENDYSQPQGQLIHDFLNFLKEEKMALNKVRWNLVDGLQEKENLIHMLRAILDKFVGEGILIKKKGRKESAAKGWDVFSYRVADIEENTDVIFNNSDATLYFRIYNTTNKHKNISEPYFNSKQLKIVGKFDFNKRHFFPLEAMEQGKELSQFIDDCVKKVKNV